MNKIKNIVLGVSAALLINSTAWPISDTASVNIEGMNQTMLDLLRKMQVIQQEIQQLRGEVELHSHLLENLKNRQQNDNYPETDQNNVVMPTPKAPASPVIPIAPRPSTTINSSNIHPTEQGAYDNAFSLLRSGGYEDAIKNFRDFIELYPQSSLTPNSQYWIGEAYYVTRRFKDAQGELQRMIDNYPNAAKVPDALLKIGYIQYELNQSADARASLEAVIARFPQSTAAKLALSRLEKWKK